jgi:hypothetical protein
MVYRSVANVGLGVLVRNLYFRFMRESRVDGILFSNGSRFCDPIDMPQLSECLGRILSVIGQNPSVSKSNRLHVVTFWHFFNKQYSVFSFESIGNFLEVFNLEPIVSQTQPVTNSPPTRTGVGHQ